MFVYPEAMGRTRDSTPFRQRARSLAPKQTGTEITHASDPIDVRVWITTVSGDDLEIDAVATSWTPRAVQVQYLDQHGRMDSAWVWAGAVTRR